MILVLMIKLLEDGLKKTVTLISFFWACIIKSHLDMPLYVLRPPECKWKLSISEAIRKVAVYALSMSTVCHKATSH